MFDVHVGVQLLNFKDALFVVGVFEVGHVEVLVGVV
jgi:hypothetical protein